MDFLNLRVRDIICLQDFPKQSLYDVTFVSSEICWNIYEKIRNVDNDLLRKMEVIPLFMQEEKAIVVHMYNPFADVSLVKAFLNNYCDKLRGGDKVLNKFDIWTGKYRFYGRFRKDSECVGGVRRPPAVFTIGGERGFLFYPGQPVYCRNCSVYGHTSADCDQGIKCRFCRSPDHFSRDCTQKKVCDICKRVGHLARQCEDYLSAKSEATFHENMKKYAARRARQQRPCTEVPGEGSSMGHADAARSAAPPGSGANDVAPTEQGEAVIRSVGTDGATVDTVAGVGTDSGSLAAAVGEGFQMDVCVEADHQEVEEEVQGSSSGQDGGMPGMEQGSVILASPGGLSDLISGLSDSSEEEDGEEGDEDMDSDESLACGQRLIISTAESALSAAKRAREDGAGGGGEGIASPIDGGSGSESASSPFGRKRLTYANVASRGADEDTHYL